MHIQSIDRAREKMQPSHGTESQSYFYVVWPEEKLSSASDSLSSVEGSPQSEILPGTPEQQEIVPQSDVGAAAMPGEGCAENEVADGLGAPQVLDSQPDINEIGSMAEKAITHLQRIVDAANVNQGQSLVDSLYSDDGPPPAKRRCNRLQSLPSNPKAPYPALQTGIRSETGQCLECEVKDAEIQTLRRRISALQDQIRAAAVRLEVMETKTSSNSTCKPESPVLTTTSKPNAAVSILKKNTQELMLTAQPSCSAQDTFKFQAGSGHGSKKTNGVHRELQPDINGAIELASGSGVYIPCGKLEEALREAKSGTQLARKLMDVFWDKITLAKSSVSSRSKFQYQQLEPKIISAIESYCLSYDSNTQLRDLHATMTDKCCQCRRGTNRVSQSLTPEPTVASFPVREPGDPKDEARPAAYEVQHFSEVILKS